MDGDRESCLAADMNDYLSKPIKATELEATLARAGTIDLNTLRIPSGFYLEGNP